MKVLFCFFSYANDLPLLNRAFDSVGRLKTLYPEHEITTAVVNDSNFPIADDAMPQADVVKMTDWKRGANLTHLENIFGQLEAYSKLAEETGADVIIKMDSDTMMTRLDWLDAFTGENVVSMFGTCIYRNLNHICGYFYAMTPAAIYAMLQLSRDEKIRERILQTVDGWVLEDRIYTRLGQMASARKLIGEVRMERTDLHAVAKALREGTGSRVPTTGTQWLKQHDVPIERYADQIAVTFKRFGKTEEVVNEALEGMNAFWEVIKDAPRFEPNKELRPEETGAETAEAETATANETGEARTGTITFKGANGGEAVVTATQEG